MFRVWGLGFNCPPSVDRKALQRDLLGLYWDNGKENGNCYLGFRVLGLGIEYGVYRDLIIVYPKPDFMYVLKGNYLQQHDQ